MGTFVAIYNSIGFRLEAAPFALTGGATLVYLSYPLAIAGPAVAGGLRVATAADRPHWVARSCCSPA